MARRNLPEISLRTVESAVASRYPDLSPEDLRKAASRVIDYIAETIDRGGHPAAVTLLGNGEVEIGYLTIEEILGR